MLSKMKANHKKLVRKGHCLRCGRCCTLRTILRDSKDTLLSEVMLGILDELADTGDCPHLTKVGDGVPTCNIYEERPWFCKKYPAEPADLIKGCGFYFEEALGVKQTAK